MKRQSCAFTGHRPSKLPWRYNESSEGCLRLKEVLAAQITMLVECGVTDFLSGMAEETDTICSELVLSLREKNPTLKLLCVLPHEGQADRWSDSARERYFSILR